MDVVVDKKFRNSLLDIQYDLTQNLIKDEEELPDLEIQFTDRLIELWKEYLVNDFYRIFRDEKDMDNIFYFNLDFSTWIHVGRKVIARDLAKDEIPSADVRKRLTIKISKIGDEILRFIETFCKLNCELRNLTKDTFNEIMDCLHITRHGTIEYARTSTSLIDNTYLLRKNKYKLACYFCLEKKMLKFSEEFRREYTQRFILDDQERLVVYWAFHLECKDDEFSYEIKTTLNSLEALNEHLLNWSIRNVNEPSVYYIWEKLNDNKLRKDIISFIEYSLEFDATNITCYLISQVNSEDILEVICKNSGHKILEKLRDSLRWRNYFKNACGYVRKFICRMSFVKAMQTAIMFSLEDDADNHSNRIILEELSESFRVDIKVDYVLNNKILLTIIYYMEEDIIKELLNIGNADELKTLFNKDIIFSIAKQLLERQKLVLFENFVSDVLVGDDIEEFKKKYYDLTKISILDYDDF